MTNDLSELQRIVGNRFVAEREIGRRGRRIDVLARDSADDSAVVIRIWQCDSHRELDVRRFTEEIGRAAEVRHPAVLPLLAWGHAEGLVYVVMPRMDGVSLRTWLEREGRFPFLESVLVLRAITEALVCAHRQGVLHLDLGPDDVLWSEMRVRIAGFGVAQALGASMESKPSVVGDPAAGIREDLYALGALGYRMLTGHELANEATGRPEPVSRLREHVPPGLAYLVTRCLEKNPTDRWHSADDVLKLLAVMVTPPLGYEAAHLVQQGRYLSRRDGDSIRKSLERFERAVRVNARFAPAHVGVAESSALLAVFGFGHVEKLLPRAMESAQRAVALDPSLAEAHTALAFLHLIHGWNWAASKEHFKRAIALAPRSATGRTGYAVVLLTVERRVNEAIQQCGQAVEADPLNARAVEGLGWTLSCAGRHEEALPNLRRAVDLEPGWNRYRLLGWGYSLVKRHAEAIDALTVAVERSDRHPWSLCTLGRELAAVGDAVRATEILHELLQRSRSSEGPGWVQPTVIAHLLSALGRMNETLEWLERAVDRRDPTLIFVHAAALDWEPATTHDPRWRALWARMGLSSPR